MSGTGTRGNGTVTAGIVTYLDRAAMCIEVAESAMAAGADRVVVVLNGCTPESAEALRAWAGDRAGTVELVDLGENTGSAGGFHVALREARRESRWVWLLDDDNVASLSSLDCALTNAERSDVAVLSMVRDSDEAHAEILAGADPRTAYPVPGSFFGVDIVTRLRRRGGRTSDAVAATWELSAPMPQGSYGGLVVRTDVIDAVGLPRRDFELYFDDVEYTRRIVAAGYPIRLVRDATITDLGAKWADTSDGGSYVRAMARSGQIWKTRYSMRNSTFVEWRSGGVPTKARLLLNAGVYFCYAALVTRFDLVFLRAGLRATRDGIAGRLGRTWPYGS
ncbi:glycosyltransferase [Sanguibacter massiliensis]|uniref:glycosyltransferase n=1 Tax=Sanguibacter massiliensis TaxID=1973217 RepID=UPI000C8411AE|nr:glycosyltransferase [Sanguibacter massiliensis]